MRVVLRICALLIAMPLLAGGAACLHFHLAGPERLEAFRRELQAEARKQGMQAGRKPEDVRALARAIDKVHGAVKGMLPVAGGGLLGLGALLLLVGVWPRRGGGSRPRRRAPTGKSQAGKAKQRTPGAGSEQAGSGAAEAPALSRREIKKALKAAQQLAAQSGLREAGDYLLGSGLRDEAVDYFLRAELPERAAEILHDQNRFQESADLYEKAERPEAAGAIYAQLERFDDAARCYLAADKRSVAGEMFERAGDFEQAGRCYRDIGFHRHAAQAFLQAGMQLEAARSLVETFNEEGGEQGMANPSKAKGLLSIAVKAGELFTKLNQLDDAERILVRSGAYQQAAGVAMRAGAYDRAAQLYQKVGRGDLAAEALEKAGDRAAAARVRGEYLAEQGDDAAAVDHLREAGEHQQAADLLRKLERYAESGESYLAADDYGAAAEMFRVSEQHDRASEAFERAGSLDEAAEQAALAGNLERYAQLLEQAGKPFEAGNAYAEQGQIDQAIRLLQRIEPDEPNFREACAMLGRLFRDKGMHSLSINKLEQATGGQDVTRATVDACYELGQALSARGAHERAVEIYEKILAFDYHYKDVSERLEAAKAARQQDPTDGSDPSTLPKARGRYQLIRELGRGGMGVVYLARDSVLEREVAYKVLPEGLRGNPTALKKFLREAKAAAQLNHQHIVTVYDAGESEHGFYLAMEYVDGTTLKELLQRKGAIAPGGVLYVLRQMCEALAYAHGKKVVHRDIKTANTMWTQAKHVKIMDFGLAKLMEEVRNATTLVSGTPFYMSPEQTLGRNVDHRTDIYSLGVTIFELATGELPFKKGNIPYHHVHTAPPDPREINGEIPEPLSQLILRCLEKAPEARYSAADEILQELERLGARQSGS